MENHMGNGNPISLKDVFYDEGTGKPEFKAEIKKAIDAAFQKDSLLKEFKIQYDETGKVHPTYIKPNPNNVMVFINRAFDGCEHEYLIQTFICEYQLTVVCVFEESFSENLKNAISTSKWLPNINECYIETAVTFK